MTGRLPLTIRPFSSVSNRITTLGSRPDSIRNFFRFILPLTRMFSTTVCTPNPAAINPDRDPLVGEFVPRGQFPGTEP